MGEKKTQELWLFFVSIQLNINKPGFFFFSSTVGKAFAVATAIIFGGATLIFGLAVSKLEMQNVSIYLPCLKS